RIRLAHEMLLTRQCRTDIDAAEFDRMCFGEALPQRRLDPRVVRAIARIGKFSGEPATATNCAAEAGLSASRFLHLFKQETGISFRSFRAWKRARHLLHFANQDVNLAHLAQDIGYPDSTHFSHSIRRFYGLKPRAIFSGSRDLAIYRSGQEAGEAALTLYLSSRRTPGPIPRDLSIGQSGRRSAKETGTDGYGSPRSRGRQYQIFAPSMIFPNRVHPLPSQRCNCICCSGR